MEGLAGLSGGPSLLKAADSFSGLWLVGGAVRDLLLGRSPRDVDLAVEGEVLPVASALGDVVEEHGRFGTATVRAPDGGHVNLARTRSESYARPGALPDVRPASIDEDLARRDFTVNAIAVGLSPDVRGEVRAADHALSDVEERLLRVLHDGSFLDDPTRLLRLVRYATRLGFAVDGRTAGLAGKATRRTVSGDRIGNEVRLALAEPDPVAALVAAAGFGEPVPRPDPELAQAALALLPADGRPDLLVLASAGPGGLDENLRALGFTAPDVARAVAAADARTLAAELEGASRPSQIAAAARGRPPEAVALAGALGAEDAARAWLDDLRHVELAITGRDLLDAGIAEGPDLGRRLQRALDRKLDGELATGRDAELAAALSD